MVNRIFLSTSTKVEITQVNLADSLPITIPLLWAPDSKCYKSSYGSRNQFSFSKTGHFRMYVHFVNYTGRGTLYSRTFLNLVDIFYCSQSIRSFPVHYRKFKYFYKKFQKLGSIYSAVKTKKCRQAWKTQSVKFYLHATVVQLWGK